MKTRHFLLMLIITSVLISCEEKVSEPSINKTILGSWLVTSEKTKVNESLTEDEDGITTDKWGFGHISSLKLNPDNTFDFNVDKEGNPNVGPLASGIEVPPSTWILDEDPTIITLHTAVEYVGLILRDTAQFQLSIDSEDQLIFENEEVLLKHKRID